MRLIFTKIIAINLTFLFLFNLTLSDEIIYPKKKPILSEEIIEKNQSKELTPEEFEEYVINSGAKGSFMVYRSKKKDDELGIDTL